MRFLNKDTRFFCPKEKKLRDFKTKFYRNRKNIKKSIRKKRKLLFKHKHVFNKYLFAVIFLQ